MDPEKIELLLEEYGIDSDNVKELSVIISQMGKEHTPPENAIMNDLSIQLMNETDWRKRAIIAAEILKRNLDA